MRDHVTRQPRPVGAECPSALVARIGRLIARQQWITDLRQSLVVKSSIQFGGTLGDRATELADFAFAARRSVSLFELALLATCQAHEQLPPLFVVASHWHIVSPRLSHPHGAEAGEE